MKKVLVCVVLISLILMIGTTQVFAGGGRERTTTLTVAINRNPSNPEFIALQEIAREYSAANPGINVEVLNYPEYEQVMRSRMAANDLPDLFSTHGWSVIRYSEYLEPLNNQPWARLVCPTIRPVITNDRGQMFVLPFDVDSAGIAFNNQSKRNLKLMKTWQGHRKNL